MWVWVRAHPAAIRRLELLELGGLLLQQSFVHHAVRVGRWRVLKRCDQRPYGPAVAAAPEHRRVEVVVVAVKQIVLIRPKVVSRLGSRGRRPPRGGVA